MRTKRQHSEEARLSGNHVSFMGLISRIYKVLLPHNNNEKLTTQFKKWVKDLKIVFQENKQITDKLEKNA